MVTSGPPDGETAERLRMRLRKSHIKRAPPCRILPDTVLKAVGLLIEVVLSFISLRIKLMKPGKQNIRLKTIPSFYLSSSADRDA